MAGAPPSGPTNGAMICLEGVEKVYDAGETADHALRGIDLDVRPGEYIALMGPQLQEATEVAILNANYLAARLGEAYPVLYSGRNGRVAHECIIDLS